MVTRFIQALGLALALASCSGGARPVPDHANPPGHGTEAHTAAAPPEGGRSGGAREEAAIALARILTGNDAFVREHGAEYFAPFEDQQHPRVTVVACADSRFHAQALEGDPDDDLFVVRNIGNQVDSSAGSVEYGVRHLHTPILLVVGHVGCGAVKAALDDYGDEPPSIRHELDGLHLSLRRVMDEGRPFEERWHDGVLENVHRQVENAMKEYADLVRSGDLFVVGAVYDFRDEMKGGRGRLHIVGVNGSRDAERSDPSGLLEAARRLAGAPPR